MSKPIIAIKLNNRDYAALVNLGNRVVVNMTANANFTTPLPALATVTTAITAVEDAIALWGPQGNRGSHANLVDLRTKALDLANLLKAEAHYVQETAQIAAGSDYVTMGSIIITSGFELASTKTPQGVLEMVQNFHNFISRQLNPNQVKLKWKKPLNTTSAGNVKSYLVYRGATNVFSAATEIGTTTRTSFIDTNDDVASKIWNYWVVPVNTAGAGVVSDVITVTVASI
jgi:hypothetical protein